MTSGPHEDAIRAAADRLGIVVREDDGVRDGIVLSYRGRSVGLRKGRRPSFLDPAAEALCDDKAACKSRLASLGIPVPAGIVVEVGAPNQAAIEAQLARGRAQVAKPRAGTRGEHVRVGLTTLEEVLRHVAATPAQHEALVLEDEAEGVDLRIQAVGGRLFAACVREPAYVVGDGVHDVATLVAARRAVMKAENPENVLELDADALALLEEQGLAPGAIPARERRVRLGRVANMARGAVATDVTGAIHPRYAEWIDRIARAFPIALFAVDAMTTDVGADPERCAVVLEVNARPEWLHHTFSGGRRHDVAEAILRSFFDLDTPAVSAWSAARGG